MIIILITKGLNKTRSLSVELACLVSFTRYDPGIILINFNLIVLRNLKLKNFQITEMCFAYLITFQRWVKVKDDS